MTAAVPRTALWLDSFCSDGGTFGRGCGVSGMKECGVGREELEVCHYAVMEDVGDHGDGVMEELWVTGPPW